MRSRPGVFADSYNAPVWSPTALTGLQVWLDASNAGSITHSSGAVSQWNDLSSNARHHVQATAGNKPTTGTRTINGLNALDFDGTGDWVQYTAGAVVAQPLTMAAVIQSDSTAAGDVRIYGRGATTALNLGRSAAAWHYHAGTSRTAGTANTSAHLLVGCYSATASRLRLDRTQIHDATAASIGTNGFTAIPWVVGGTTGSASLWDGLIAEIVITSTNLDGTGDLTTLESYLRNKWGTP